MRKIMLVIAAAVLTVSLAGCQESMADLHRDAQFKQACVKAGGRVVYVGLAGDQLFCDLSTEDQQ